MARRYILIDREKTIKEIKEYLGIEDEKFKSC